jgi:hypothetical protein
MAEKVTPRFERAHGALKRNARHVTGAKSVD